MFLKYGVMAVTAIPLLAVILGDTSSGDVNYVNYLLNGGPFAVVVFLIITDRLTTPGERDRLRQELSAGHEREAKVNDNIRTEVVPALTRTVDALAANADGVAKLDDAVGKLDTFLASAERKLDRFITENRNPKAGG